MKATPRRSVSLLSLLAIPLALATPGPHSHAQDEEGFVSLFDGETLEGWEFTEGVWQVEDGVITGRHPEQGRRRNEFISTGGNFSNFDLQFSIRCAGDPAQGLINSGIQIRSVRMPDGVGMAGYQVDCGAGWFGKIYDEHRRGLIYPEPLDAAAMNEALDVFGWNRYRILAEGPRIRVWINDVQVTDFTEQHPAIPLDGHIGIQVHGGGPATVQFKDIRIRELPPTPDAPTWEALGGVGPALELAKQAPAPEAGSAPQPDEDGYFSATDQLTMFELPAGYKIELVAQESEGIGKFIAVYFDQRGRMWTQTALEYPVDANDNPAAAEALYQRHARDKVIVYPREPFNAPLPEGGLTDPAVFADGLAIPLGILPWGPGDACYVHHGHDLLLLTDTTGDGRADKREVLLTGFGVQDSHLLPHQFTRAPGDWIWMAQGLFNHSEVRRPGEDTSVTWTGCSMARMRPDGSGFEVTSTGPNNIWGLVITGEGESFIQEANDYGYPVMPFHEYAYYPGGMGRHKKSYQPDFPPAASFRMGGTGLSGLALLESGPAVDPDSEFTMLVANPITSKINTIGMKRDGDGWALEKLPDFISCSDPHFRPVALTQGPDGAIYIVDWYNKIIAHNEVPRNHPERDRVRGRIWRVSAEADGGRVEVPDFASLSTDDLIGMLGTWPTARAHIAAQTLIDRADPAMIAPLKAALTAADSTDALRIQALWILPEAEREAARPLLASENRNVRRELARFPEFAPELADDADSEVRSTSIITLARQIGEQPQAMIGKLLATVKPALSEPTGPRSHGGQAPIPVGEAYSRAYDRFLVRRFLEQHPEELVAFLDSDAAAGLSGEANLLAVSSLERRASAARLVALLPGLERQPLPEEILLLAQFPELPGSGEALAAMLGSENMVEPVANALLSFHAQLDAGKLAPLLARPAAELLKGDRWQLGARLAATFAIRELEPELLELVRDDNAAGEHRLAALEALRQLGTEALDLMAELAVGSDDPAIREVATTALGESPSEDSASKLLGLYENLAPAQQRTSIRLLSGRREGAEALVGALLEGTLPGEALDGSSAERLSAVLGNDPRLAELMDSMSDLFSEVLAFDGGAQAWSRTGIDLTGPFTFEAWVRLAPGITNADGLFGSDPGLSVNFHDGKFRLWVAGRGDLLVSGRNMTPDFWTHLAVTRDEQGTITFYCDGEPDGVATAGVTGDFPDVRIGWTPVNSGTEGGFAGIRIWDHVRTGEQIRDHFDRSFAPDAPPEGLLFQSGGEGGWGELQAGARVARTTDGPPLLTAAQAEELEAKFVRLRELGERGGDVAKGQVLAVLCTSCHVVNGVGGNIGPDISGVGASGLEALLRNILTPDAAMEAGYRIYRVEMNNGDIIDAFFVSEDENAVVVRQLGAPDRRIERRDIAHTGFIRRSLMPAGLLDPLNDQQVADLLAYLMSLK